MAGKIAYQEGDPLKKPFDEQETIISFSPPQISKTAEVYTCMPNMLNKLRKLSESRPDCVKIKRDLGDALFAEVDRACVKITPKRIVSDEQRRAAAERLAQRRKANDAIRNCE